MPVLSEPKPPQLRRRRWKVLALLLLLLAPAVLVLPVVTSMLMQVERWGPARLYMLSAAAPYPPPGVSGVSAAPGQYYRQNLRLGDCVLEWHWLPRTHRASGR